MGKRFDSLPLQSQQNVIDLFCRNHEYQDTMPGGYAPDGKGGFKMLPPKNNPESRMQFVTRRMNEWVVEKALEQRTIEAAAVAQDDSTL